jgi:Trypsin-co-occurring domain 1
VPRADAHPESGIAKTGGFGTPAVMMKRSSPNRYDYNKGYEVETVAFPLEDGGHVLVRVAAVEPTYGGVVTRGGRAAEAVAEAGQTFESALTTIRDVADAVLHQLARLAVPPEEVRVEFGLELTTKAAVVVASASATAQLHVALAWNPPQRPSSQPMQE